MADCRHFEIDRVADEAALGAVFERFYVDGECGGCPYVDARRW